MTNVSTGPRRRRIFNSRLTAAAAAAAYPSRRSWEIWAELLEEEERIVVGTLGRVLRQNAA